MSNDEGRPDFDDLDEQAMADAMASLSGCGAEGVAIPMGGKAQDKDDSKKMPPGHPDIPAGHPPIDKMPPGHPAIDMIPPGHPPMVGEKPPGHPPVPDLPEGHPPIGGMPEGHRSIAGMDGHPGAHADKMPPGHPPLGKMAAMAAKMFKGGMPPGHPPIGKIPANHPPMTGKKPPGHPPVGAMSSGGHPAHIKKGSVATCPHGGGSSSGEGGVRQRHGGARSVGFRPGGGPEAIAYEERTGIKAPRIIAWEITRSCNLNCVHCRAASRYGTYEGELSLDEIKGVIDNIVTISNPIIILTGGEPLLRDDIWDIIDYCHEKGAMPVVGTNATMIPPEVAEKLAKHGIPRISVSIDFPTAKEHDEFRVMPGSFEQAVEGIKNAKAAGVGVQINTTVTKHNADRLEEIHQLAEDLHVDAFHIFMLVPTGRASDLTEQELSPERYEEVLTWAYHRQKTSDLHFKPTDAPHYYRIIRQLAHAEGREVTVEEYGLDAMTRGCLGGITFCFISHIGDVQPCGYFDMQLGNVREEAYADIWTSSKVFNDLRDYSKLKGKCGACEFRGVCGGCRARALEATGGDYLAAEPYCSYVPSAWKGETYDLQGDGTQGDSTAKSDG